MTQAAPARADLPPAPMRHSIFSVQDHHPSLARTVPALYDQVIAQAELAEALGYDTFFVAEHHFHEYGAVPNPAVFLAALAQRTRRLRLGSAISILTFHHPLTVAESYAMVDVLSGGRLTLGTGSGYLKHEFAGYRVDLAEKRERFDEGLSVMKRALSGERVTHKGRYWDLEDVAINVPCVQKPTPPLYVAILAREAAFHVARQGNHIFAVPYASVDAFDEVAGIVDGFRRGWSESGQTFPGDAVFAFHTHVAETDEEARRRAAAAFDLYVATRLYARRQTYDDIMASGLSLMGGIDTVVGKLVRLHRMGIRHVMHLQNFGMLDTTHVHDSMRLLAEEVVPRVNRILGDGGGA
ncbi:MAG: LLM class flavin-dependent oxidoreductase [Rhodocyclaceae bacterium]|nr:LLM class flavin-dependent oxidoreductase [Rhodocyclaceae bacterium]